MNKPRIRLVQGSTARHGAPVWDCCGYGVSVLGTSARESYIAWAVTVSLSRSAPPITIPLPHNMTKSEWALLNSVYVIPSDFSGKHTKPVELAH